MEFREKFAEMTVTEWRGIRVRLTLEVPKMLNSMTTQMVIDERDLAILRYLTPPKDIELLTPEEARFALMKWESERENAKRLVDIISNKIAMEITHAVGKEI